MLLLACLRCTHGSVTLEGELAPAYLVWLCIEEHLSVPAIHFQGYFLCDGQFVCIHSQYPTLIIRPDMMAN